MRPVLLEIDGFTSYKNKAVIDFRDTDFFALVGPTGSGKSTILDAMAFALYRSAPRWNDVGAVAPALSPTANRAIVRLIFDANGKRYSVIRDVRRGGGKTAPVTVKEQRLEQFHNADDDGTGETDVLEAGNAVTAKVTELLGLTFQEFCTCVVLPQGDFSKFLHATSGERQAILKKLLGYQIYDNIRSAADARARDHHARAEGLQAHLESMGAVGESVIAERQARVTQLETLEKLVADELLPAHKQATDAAAAINLQVQQVTSEQSLLGRVSVPPDVADLQHARAATAEAVVDAQAAESVAELDDQTARDALAAAPARAALEIVKRNWADLAAVTLQIPGLQVQATDAGAALRAAEVATTEGDSALIATRNAHESAKAEAESTAAAAERAGAELGLLLAIKTPAGVSELAELLDSAAKSRASASAAVADAEKADERARDALAAAPDAGTLSTATSLAAQVAKTAQVMASDDTDDSAILAKRQAAVVQAEQAVEEINVNSHVHVLRETLTAGAACPVCEQTVSTIPRAAVVDEDQLPKARAELKAAREQLAKADREAAARTAKRSAERDRLASDQRRLDELLAQLDSTVDGLPGLTASRVTLQETAVRAAARLRTARNSLIDAQEAVEKLTDRRRNSVTELRSARDTVPGAPLIDDSDVAAAWGSLTTWAAERAAAIPIDQLKQEAAQAHSDFIAKATDLKSSEAAAKQANQRRLDTALASQKAQAALSNAETRRDELTQTLATAIDADSVEIELRKVALLEASCTKARAQLAAARTAVRTAQSAQKQATERASASWAALRRARDPLTGLGAPEPGAESSDLQQAWTTLARWAAAEVVARRAQLEELTASTEEARRSIETTATALESQLVEAGVEAVTGTATRVLAGSIAQAHAALNQAKSDFDKAKNLLDDARREKEKAQVAQELSRLMRVTNFPQWLVNSALDVLVGEASSVLFELSNRQFELTTKDGDIFVIDHNNADLTRSVKTLSGGETFQASLALALALSRQMSTMSTAGSTKLEAIFLDEGFGTLDPETLDEVASTLENLAHSGSRMVGVVTHVAALAERIPVQFRVTRDDLGSHVEVVRT
ncbi:AAA family ATPase [Smaragdicoccus niigatensis]|uniref:AAA family ATPase n=1 Tax=Smaragdicoccus niigatensis TaxID=359359 RepID=UPI0003651831|nr:SMC family ATPase [Smaragdicoccus niigatensis]